MTWRLPSFRGLLTLLAGEGVSRLLSFAAIAVLTRRLGDAGWAPVAVALTGVQFGALLVESGMRLYGAREVAQDPTAIRRLLRPVVGMQLAMAVALVVLVLAAARLGLVDPALAVLLPGYAVSLLALPLLVPWIFQGLGAMHWVVLPQVARFAVFLALAAHLVVSPERASWIPWLEAAAMAAGAAVALVAARRWLRDPAARGARVFDPAILRESLPIAGSQMLWVVRMYLPTALLWVLVARESVARFDVAHRLLMVLQAMLTMYLTNLYTPLARAAPGPRPRFTALLRSSTLLAGAAAVLAALLLSARPGALLGLVYGSDFDHPEAAACLVVIAFVLPMITVRGHAHYALVALGRQRLELACALAGSVLLVALLLWWVPSGGAPAAARAMLVSESATLALTWLALRRALRRAGPEPVARPAAPAA